MTATKWARIQVVGSRPVRRELPAANPGAVTAGKPAGAGATASPPGRGAAPQATAQETDDDRSGEESEEEEEAPTLLSRFNELIAQCAPVDTLEAHLHDDWLKRSLGDVFLEASDPITVPPGEAFITQGEPCDSIFLVMKGSVVLRKTLKDGSVQELSKIRYAGDTLGELSFLLGSLPVLSVHATPLAAGSTTVIEPTVVCQLPQAKARQLISDKPETMQRFFKTISITLANRVQTASSEMQALLSSEMKEQLAGEDGLNPARKGRTALQIAQSFGLKGSQVMAGDKWAAERMLLASIDCTLTMEESGVQLHKEVPSTIFLFRSHLCIEQTALGCLKYRTSIPLADMLGIVYSKTKSDDLVDASEAPSKNRKTDAPHVSFKEEVPPKPELVKRVKTAGPGTLARTVSQKISLDRYGDDEVASFTLEMRGRSLLVSMAASIAKPFAREVENARLRAVDLSQLKAKTKVTKVTKVTTTSGRSRLELANGPRSSSRLESIKSRFSKTSRLSSRVDEEMGEFDPLEEAHRLLVSNGARAQHHQRRSIGPTSPASPTDTAHAALRHPTLATIAHIAHHPVPTRPSTALTAPRCPHGCTPLQ